MKKFLSLALSLVMVLSLTTIGAGATEYKDFTDKDEIQYAEAVSVLNRLGIITGYSEGDFRPEGELTRGAAAKIIVSLLIGPSAAEALGNNSSPFPDVPAGNNFAGVIGYCKTAKIIGGYGDGTFRPQGTLTGYAFAKMLLGALGYKTEYEGFEGAGWNMNVARIGGEVGLFDRISFNGNETVTREQACQLALNTLKSTMVEYSGGMDISTSDGTSIVAKPDRNYKVSANKEINSNIFRGQPMAGGGNEYYTLEFGEEHFVDLRLDAEATNRTDYDDFGRPSNVWSYKKVTIGTFPVDPDFLYTEQTQHSDATDAAKNRATGLGSYHTTTTDSSGNKEVANLWYNGMLVDSSTTDANLKAIYDDLAADKVSAISDCTDNGTVVEVYVSDNEANYITDVVVIQTQLMEIRRVGSDYVSLQMYDNGSSDDSDESAPYEGFNNKALNKRVENVQAEDDMYGLLSGLKVGDIVAVIPYTNDDGATWEVGDAYVPETVSGAITGVVDYGKTSDTRNAVSVTVGGTAYDIAVWNKDLHDIDDAVIKATKKDITLYLDRNGNAMLAKDVGETSDWMVVGAFRQALENGRIVHLVTGWDISGTAIELNVGTTAPADSIKPGDLVKYSSTTSNIAEWRISPTDGVYDIDITADAESYEIKSSNTHVMLAGKSDSRTIFDKNVKFIYVNYSEEDGEVESIEVKTVRQNVTHDELAAQVYKNAPADYNIAQACVKDNAVKAVVVKGESNDAIATNMLYVRDYYGSASYDSTNKMVFGYRVAMVTPTGFDDDVVIYSYERLDRGDFASYSAAENADHSDFYTLRRHNNFVDRTTATYGASFEKIVSENNGFVELANYTWVNGNDDAAEPSTSGDRTVQVSTAQASLGTGNEQNIVDVKNAYFLDLRSASEKGSLEIGSYTDLKNVMMYRGEVKQRLNVVMIVNDNPDNDGFRTVSLVVVKSNRGSATSDDAIDSIVNGRKALESMSFGSENWDTHITNAGSSGATIPNMTTASADETSVKGKISYTHNGDKAELTVTNSTDSTTVSADRDGVYTLAAGKTYAIVVKVTAKDGTFTNYRFNLTVDQKGKEPYQNSVVADLDLEGVSGYDPDHYTSSAADVEAGNGVIKVVDGTLTAPVILTGDINDTKDQITEALECLGYSSVSFVGVNGTKRLIEANGPDNKGVSIEFDEATAKTVVTVDNTKKLVGATIKLNAADIDAIQYVSSVNGDQLEDDPSTVTVKPNDVIVTKAYVQIGDLSSSANVNGADVTVTYYLNSVAPANAVTLGTTYAKATDKLIAVVTLDAEDNDGKTNGLEIQFSASMEGNPEFTPVTVGGATPAFTVSQTTVAKDTITFAGTGETGAADIVKGDKLTVEFSAVGETAVNNQSYNAPYITYTRATD